MPIDINRFVRDYFKLPRPTLQKRWAREWERITVHTRGRYPKSLIDSRRPYEAPEVAKFRRDNYVPFTQDPFNRAITNLQRIFSKSNVTFHGPEELLEYMQQPAFRETDMATYFSRNVTRRMIEDPNGVLVWWVDDIPELTIAAAPSPYLVLSKNIMHITHEVMSWKAMEKSPVSVPNPAGGQDRVLDLQGEVYYIVTTEAYYKLQQYGDIEKRQFELVPHYAHRLGYLPVYTLGGEETGATNPRTNEEEVWLTSYFMPAVAFADECVRQVSDHQGVMVTVTSPIREVDAPACPTCKGKREVAEEVPAQGGHMPTRRMVECSTCKGEGRVVPTGPYGILYRDESTMMNEGKGREIPVMRFLSPDVGIVKYSGDYWMQLLDKVNKALNLLFVEQAQSGVAKEKDREDEVAMLDRIGEHYYGHLFRNSMMTVADLRMIQYDAEQVYISLPPTFVVKTEADLMEELKAINETGVNPLFRIEAAREHVRKRFPGNMRMQRMYDVLSWYDPLFGYTTNERMSMQAKGAIDSMTERRSIYGPAALQRLVGTDGEAVLDLDAATLEGKLDDLINTMAPEPEPEPDLIPVDEFGKPRARRFPRTE
jgi:hypothetical protein